MVRGIIVLFLIGSAFLLACKSKKNVAEKDKTNEHANADKMVGYVSHGYKNTNCSPVVIVPIKNQDTLILWPNKGLGDFDKEGLWIKFKYLPLRMPSPEGCLKSIPASFTEMEEI